MKYEKINENIKYNKSDLKSIFDANKSNISWTDYYGDKKSVDFVLLEPGKTITISDYPYGYLRTDIKYSVETTKRGDRFVSQTLNPKNGKWNKPKKSTYDELKLLIVDLNGHVRTLSLDFNDSKDKIKVFSDSFKDILNDTQKIKLSNVIGYNKTMENVKFEVKTRYFKNRITGKVSSEVSIFDLKNVDECDENGILINKEIEQQNEKETKDIINSNIQYESVKAFANL